MYAQRPIVLNGIDEFVRKGDLADRGLSLQLPPVRPGRRREELEFWAAFEQDHPRILGGLLDAVAGGFRELPSVRLAELPRMADFARFGEAVGRGLGWPAGTFLSAYHANRRDATVSSIESSALGAALLESAQLHGWPNWTLSPAEMLDELTCSVGKRVAASSGWPKTPTMFGNQLRRLAPQLREHGICVIFGKNRDSRVITLATRPVSVSPFQSSNKCDRPRRNRRNFVACAASMRFVGQKRNGFRSTRCSARSRPLNRNFSSARPGRPLKQRAERDRFIPH